MKVDLLSRLGVKILQLEPEDVVQPYRLNLISKRKRTVKRTEANCSSTDW